jgi:betaine reductase
MMKVRVMHFINQFFAGIGAEEKADAPAGHREGPIGPGKRLQALLGDSAEIVVTAFCGDNYFAGHQEEVLQEVLTLAKAWDIKMLIAGPAFAAGRYGFSCIEACHSISTSLGLNCITGMHIQNPGVEGYKSYKDRRIFLFPTGEAVKGMDDALSRMARFAMKLSSGSVIGAAAGEGYVPRGLRFTERVDKTGAERAIDMVLDKIAGRPFVTEIPVEIAEAIPITRPVSNMKEIHLALATTSGVVPHGNPDGMKSFRNTIWGRYLIDNLATMTDEKWDVVHNGYDNTFMNRNPNYGVPLDACRELEKEGAFGRLYPYFYSATGATALTSVMQRIGREMAADMKSAGVNAVLLVST